MNGAHLTYNEQADRSGDELKSSSGPLRLIAMRFCPWCERVLLTLAQKNIRYGVMERTPNCDVTFIHSILIQRRSGERRSFGQAGVSV